MTGRAYAVASGKGGVGKTTTVVNLGVMLRVAGHQVAVVDADLGMANMAAFLGIEHQPTIHEVLAGEASLDEAIIEDPDGFAIVAGTRDLEGFAVADPTRLGEMIETLTESFDYVLVDTGAGLSHESVLPLGLTDGVILVTTPDPVAIEDTKKTAELADIAHGSIAGAVITRVGEDTDPESIAQQLGTELLGAIPEDPAVSASIDAGRPLIINAPDSDAAKAYRQLTMALTETEVPPLEALQSVGDARSNEEEGDEETGDETVGENTTEPDEEASTADEADEGETESEDETAGEAESDDEESDEPAIEATEEATEPASGDDPDPETAAEDETEPERPEAEVQSRSAERQGTNETDDEPEPETDTEDTERRGGLLSRLLSPFR